MCFTYIVYNCVYQCLKRGLNKNDLFMAGSMSPGYFIYIFTTSMGEVENKLSQLMSSYVCQSNLNLTVFSGKTSNSALMQAPGSKGGQGQGLPVDHQHLLVLWKWIIWPEKWCRRKGELSESICPKSKLSSHPPNLQNVLYTSSALAGRPCTDSCA